MYVLKIKREREREWERDSRKLKRDSNNYISPGRAPMLLTTVSPRARAISGHDNVFSFLTRYYKVHSMGGVEAKRGLLGTEICREVLKKTPLYCTVSPRSSLSGDTSNPNAVGLLKTRSNGNRTALTPSHISSPPQADLVSDTILHMNVAQNAAYLT